MMNKFVVWWMMTINRVFALNVHQDDELTNHDEENRYNKKVEYKLTT